MFKPKFIIGMYNFIIINTFKAVCVSMFIYMCVCICVLNTYLTIYVVCLVLSIFVAAMVIDGSLPSYSVIHLLSFQSHHFYFTYISI